jgi:ATP-binding cassette, subfamily B, bacterial MsbA
VNRISCAFGKTSLKFLFDYLSKGIDPSAKSGLKRALLITIRRRRLIVFMLCAGVGAAFFESSTIGILAGAVSLLVESKGSVGDQVFSAFVSKLGVDLTLIDPKMLFVWLVVAAVAAQILKSGLIYGNEVAQAYLSIFLRKNTQEAVTERVCAMDYKDIAAQPPGVIASYIDQSSAISEVISLISQSFLAVSMLGGFLLLMLMMSPLFAVSIILVVLALWLALGKIVSHLRRLSEVAARSRLVSSRWTFEYLSAPRLIRIFNATTQARTKINETRKRVLAAELSMQVKSAAIKPVLETVSILGAGLILVGALFFVDEQAKKLVPKIFIYVLVFWRAKPHLMMLNNVRVRFNRLLSPLMVVEQFLEHTENAKPDAVLDPVTPLQRKVVFTNVGFRYPETSQDVLTDVSFEVGMGKTIAIVGQSGAGKSTVLDLLVALYEPSRGHIEVDGVPLSSCSRESWRENIGMVEQKVFLLNASIAENISFGRPGLEEADIQRACRIANVDEFLEGLPSGLDTVIGEKGFRLSGGQQQRVALARALISRPKLLILDEATSSLDSFSERLIQQTLEKIRGDCATVVVAHRLSTIRNADRILVLDRGFIVEQGSWQELVRRRGGIFSNLWSHQAVGKESEELKSHEDSSV